MATDAEGVRTLLFMTVPPPRSGNVVSALKKIESVVSAAAVYSGVDVVAELSASEDAIAAVRSLGAPITNLDPFTVDEVLPGPRFHDASIYLRSSCRAYIRCSINLIENTLGYAAGVLQGLSCTVAVYLSNKSAELILEVLAFDKREFDDAVMSSVQYEWAIVDSTRTYIVINSLAWSRWAEDLGPAIFISFAEPNNEFATTLKRQLEADTGLRCWKYDDDLPHGEPSWPDSIDAALERAPLHLFLLSQEFDNSTECQREFGQSLRIVKHPQDICVLLIPGYSIDDVALRYRIRNCIIGDRFLSYPRLLDWVHTRLATASA